MQREVFDAVVVGGGPAGASCAQWLAMLGLSPALVERGAQLGGLQNDDPYPSRFIVSAEPGATGQDIARAIHDNVLALGIPVLLSTAAMAVQREEGGGFRVTAEAVAGGGLVLSCRNVVLRAACARSRTACQPDRSSSSARGGRWKRPTLPARASRS